MFRKTNTFRPPTLDGIQQRLLDSLCREGIAVAPFHDLFDDEPLWLALQADISVFAQAVEPRVSELRRREDPKAYLVRRFVKSPLVEHRKKLTFSLADRWLRLGLSSRVLDIVSSYRGEPTHLADFDCWYTIPDPGAEAPVASQRWHRTPWDEHVVQLFAYFSDVDEGAGPFEYLRHSPAGGRYGDLWPAHGGEHGVYPPQAEFLAAVDPADIVTVTGPPGTVILADTGGFSRIGWAQHRPQLLSYHTYISPQSAHAVKYLTQSRPGYRFRVDWSSDDGGLSDAARFAIAWSDRRT